MAINLEDYSLEKFVKVNDNWHSNYRGQKVKIKLFIVKYIEDFYTRFTVYGTESVGVEKEFKGTFERCEKKWKEWKKLYDNIPHITHMIYYLNKGFRFIGD